MSFTFDAKTSAGVTASTGLTVSHTTGATATLFVCKIAVRGAQTIPSLAYGGDALSLAVETGYSLDFERTAIYYKVSPKTGANNLVVGLSASVEHAVSISTYVSGATPSLDVTAVNSGATGAPNATVSGAVGGLGVSVVSSEAAINPPYTGPGADETLLHNFGTGSWGIASAYDLAPSAAEQFDFTPNQGDVWAMSVAVFKEAVGAVVLPPRPVVVGTAVDRSVSW